MFGSHPVGPRPGPTTIGAGVLHEQISVLLASGYANRHTWSTISPLSPLPGVSHQVLCLVERSLNDVQVALKPHGGQLVATDPRPDRGRVNLELLRRLSDGEQPNVLLVQRAHDRDTLAFIRSMYVISRGPSLNHSPVIRYSANSR